jgi:hypothetical protein
MSKPEKPATPSTQIAEVKNIGGVTPAQINAWKAKHKEVYAIAVDDEGKELVGIFKKPDMATISAASRFASSDPVKSGEILFESCWLGGDIELKELDELKVSCFGKLAELFKVKEATIKKL